MIDALIVLAFGSVFAIAFLHELRITLRDRKFSVVNAYLARSKNKQDSEDWIPINDDEEILEEENREEDADEGDDDAILGL